MRSITPFWLKRNAPVGSTFSIWKDMDDLFEDFPVVGRNLVDEKEFLPATEIAETEKNYILSVDLPGLKKDEIKIEVLDNTLTLSGERKREEKFDDGKVRRIEKSYGSFKRSFSLPANADAEKIEAKYDSGVLELSIPKAKLTTSKKIEVQ